MDTRTTRERPEINPNISRNLVNYTGGIYDPCQGKDGTHPVKSVETTRGPSRIKI